MPDAPEAQPRPDVIEDPCSFNVGADGLQKSADGCAVRTGQVLTFYYEEPDSPAPKENSMEPALPVVPSPASAPATDVPVHPPAAHDAAAPAVAQETQSGTVAEAPSANPTAGELGDLISQSGGGALGLVAALIAVVGGTAGFKLWTKISEQKHEQQMKRLDIEQANAGLSGSQPPPCQTAHQALVADIKAIQADLSALKVRIERVEKSVGGFDPSVDVGDLEDRVEVLEKALRKKSRGSAGGE